MSLILNAAVPIIEYENRFTYIMLMTLWTDETESRMISFGFVLNSWTTCDYDLILFLIEFSSIELHESK